RTLPVRVHAADVRRRPGDRLDFSPPGDGIRRAQGPGTSSESLMNRETGTGKYEQLLMRCRNLEPVVTAVAHPCEATALAGAIDAAANGLITPILVGPTAKIQEVASQNRIDISRA